LDSRDIANGGDEYNGTESRADELRGRMMAVYATMFMGVQPIGSLLAGGVARHLGAPRTLAIFGTLVLAGSLIFVFSRGDALTQTAKVAAPAD